VGCFVWLFLRALLDCVVLSKSFALLDVVSLLMLVSIALTSGRVLFVEELCSILGVFDGYCGNLFGAYDVIAICLWFDDTSIATLDGTYIYWLLWLYFFYVLFIVLFAIFS